MCLLRISIDLRVILGLVSIAVCALAQFDTASCPHDTSGGSFGPRLSEIDVSSSVPLFEYFPADDASRPSDDLSFETTTFVRSMGGLSNDISGRVVRSRRPLDHFSVVPPLQGCGHGRYTVAETASARGCIVGVNAGFFSTRTGECLGNIVSESKILQTSGSANANFGITESGKFLVGYITDDQVAGVVLDEHGNRTQKIDPVRQLVAGVVWLVRNGTNWVDESAKIEDLSVQETGSAFLTVKSARVAIGHDSLGRLLILQVDGKSWERGADLYEMADLMIGLGAINAINLDGGGSATMTLNGTVVSIPSDGCPGELGGSVDGAGCPRAVSSIICLHSSDWMYLSLGGSSADGWTSSSSLGSTFVLLFCCAVACACLVLNVGIVAQYLLRVQRARQKRAALRVTRELRKEQRNIRRLEIQRRKAERREKRILGVGAGGAMDEGGIELQVFVDRLGNDASGGSHADASEGSSDEMAEGMDVRLITAEAGETM